jgi:hypothetical protein
MCYNAMGDRVRTRKQLPRCFPSFLIYEVMEEKKMAKTCNNCTTENLNVNVPYVVHESAMARSERHNKRLWIVILVLIGALIGTNLAWIIYENSFEEVITTEEIIVDAEDNGNANYIGQDGNIYNGEDYSKEEN